MQSDEYATAPELSDEHDWQDDPDDGEEMARSPQRRRRRRGLRQDFSRRIADRR